MESTRGAQSNLRLKGTDTRLNNARPSNETFFSFSSKGIEAERPIGIPCIGDQVNHSVLR